MGNNYIQGQVSVSEQRRYLKKMTDKHFSRMKSLNERENLTLVSTLQKLERKQQVASLYFRRLAHRYSYENMVRVIAPEEDIRTRLTRDRYIRQNPAVTRALVGQSITVQQNLEKKERKIKILKESRDYTDL